MNFIVDKNMPQKIENKLMSFGCVYKSTTVEAEDKAVSSHPDIQIHFISEKTAVCPPETVEYYRSILPEDITINCGISHIGITYPSICAYNIARVGRYIICNTKYAEKTILDFYRENGYKIIHTNQGYAKCNICPVSSNTFITEDKGIFNSVNDEELTAVLIPPGEVNLKGFDYGFIGGATGFISNKLLLCGSLADNPNREIILDTLKKERIELVELSDEPLYDYGSIISF